MLCIFGHFSCNAFLNNIAVIPQANSAAVGSYSTGIPSLSMPEYCGGVSLSSHRSAFCDSSCNLANFVSAFSARSIHL